MVVLIPEIHTGYFAVINMGTLYRQVLSNQIADQLLHLPDAGWSERFKTMRVELKAEEKAGEAWQSKRAPGTHPSRDLSAYAGQYQNPAYGMPKSDFRTGSLRSISRQSIRTSSTVAGIAFKRSARPPVSSTNN